MAKFLFVSIRACGAGINLADASRVAILDIPWNPSITRQAISRVFRIRQKKKVFAYRLVAANALEEEIHRASLDKRILSKMIFDGSDQYGNSRSLMCEVGENESEDSFFNSKVLKEKGRRV
jgi:DNA repair and recombination RAD54-like protein